MIHITYTYSLFEAIIQYRGSIMLSPLGSHEMILGIKYPISGSNKEDYGHHHYQVIHIMRSNRVFCGEEK